jgi:pyridoxamine 5'-phosphate oxidase
MKSLKKFFSIIQRGTKINLKEMSTNPMKELRTWYEIAKNTERYDITRMALATDDNGQPSVRLVNMRPLNKTIDKIQFFTDMNSNKSKQIEKNNKVALLIHWPELALEILIQGEASKTSKEVNEEYLKNLEPKINYFTEVKQGSEEIPGGEVWQFIKKTSIVSEDRLKEDLPESWGGFEITPFAFQFSTGNSPFGDVVNYKLANGEWEMNKKN